MGDLTGITAKNVMKMHNYTKFHSSMSEPDSRQASVSRGDSLELELNKIEEQQERQAQPDKISNKTNSSASVPGDPSKGSSGTEALNNDNYNFNHVKSSKYNEKDLPGGHFLSNGHTPKDLSPDTNDQASLLPNHTSSWRKDPADLIQPRKGSEKSTKSSTLRTPQFSSTSKALKIKTRNSIDSIDSLDSAKTISFGKL
ncbi:unnamed protein product [Allacma fusca]|uniref:Uncharacterized protein n=1 Tax=Allacma fusca TaxID=39272 RepID=A0A8J2P8E4_9HEXA|nr:unnamed protein product [Allacma fusca]